MQPVEIHTFIVLSQKLKLNTISHTMQMHRSRTQRGGSPESGTCCALAAQALNRKQPTANTSPRAEHEQPAVLRAVQEPGLSPVRHAPRHPDSITSQFRFSYLLGRSFSAMLYLATAHLTPQLSPPEASSSHIASASAACTAGCLRA